MCVSCPPWVSRHTRESPSWFDVTSRPYPLLQGMIHGSPTCVKFGLFRSEGFAFFLSLSQTIVTVREGSVKTLNREDNLILLVSRLVTERVINIMPLVKFYDRFKIHMFNIDLSTNIIFEETKPDDLESNHLV